MPPLKRPHCSRGAVVRYTAEQKTAAIARLVTLLPTEPTVYSVVRHRSQSKHTLAVDFFILRDNRPVFITSYMAIIIDGVRNDHGHLVFCDPEGGDLLEPAVELVARFLEQAGHRVMVCHQPL